MVICYQSVVWVTLPLDAFSLSTRITAVLGGRSLTVGGETNQSVGYRAKTIKLEDYQLGYILYISKLIVFQLYRYNNAALHPAVSRLPE